MTPHTQTLKTFKAFEFAWVLRAGRARDRIWQPDRATFFLESLLPVDQKPNALLKLVKWNQISCWMDLVPFNQL